MINLYGMAGCALAMLCYAMLFYDYVMDLIWYLERRCNALEIIACQIHRICGVSVMLTSRLPRYTTRRRIGHHTASE